MSGLLNYTCAICKQIQRHLSFICAKCQQSSVTHVPYFSKKRNANYLFGNASTPHLHSCHVSGDLKTPQLY